ncbi:MAG: hypothetical protein Q8N98_03925, partial [bacterium]|nr:hypothetical protein [bacterium]
DLIEEIAEAFKNLPKEEKAVFSRRIMFGVSNLWFSGEIIAEEKLGLLKNIAKKLSLSPIAYVSLPEAIDHFLRVKEGVPMTAILISAERENAEINLVKIGKPLATREIAFGEDLERETEEFLKQSGGTEVLPSRILVFGDSHAVEKITERLTRHRWNDDLSFLHLPRIEKLPEDIECQAVSFAGAAAISGKETLPAEEEKPIPAENAEDQVSSGFVLEKDIFGETKKAKVTFFKPPNMAAFFLPIFSLAKKTKVLLGLALLLGVIFLAGFSFYNFFSRATVKLYVESKKMEREEEIKVSPSAEEIDIVNKLIPGVKIQTEKQGTKKTIATGKKKIGDPAKGEVVIFNRTDKQKNFSAGTEISGPNNLKFILSEDALVASESAGADYTVVPGKTGAKVSAKFAGTEGNLSAGVEFIIGTYSKSEFVAKNETAFSGGTSKEINVVSELDQKRLLATLSAELKKEALAEISTKASSSQRLIDDSFETAVTKKSYDKEIGEETIELGLDLKIKLMGVAVEEGDLEKIITETAGADIPQGYSLKSQEVVSFSFISVDKAGILTLRANTVSTLLPSQDVIEIKKSLAGRSIFIAENYLRNLVGISDFKIDSWPPVKFFPKMPARSENITLEIIERE